MFSFNQLAFSNAHSGSNGAYGYIRICIVIKVVFLFSSQGKRERKKRCKNRSVVDVGGQKNQEIDIYHMCTYACTFVHVQSFDFAAKPGVSQEK